MACSSGGVIRHGSGLYIAETLCETVQGHTGQATCAAPYPGEPQMLLSGGRDGQVLLWDQRAGPQGPVGSFRSDASNKVTCMEVSGSTVIAGGLNKQVCQWDLR